MVSGSLKTQKSGKQYKVTALVSVSKDQMRKDLEKAGVIKGLDIETISEFTSLTPAEISKI